MRTTAWTVSAALVLSGGVVVADGTAGNLDPTFGGGDGVAVEVGINALVRDVAIDSGGRTVAVGYTSAAKWWVGRFAPNGSLDTTFAGGTGAATFFDREAHSVALDSSGRILVAGGARWTSGKKTQTDFGLIRLLPDGTLDPSFGTAGKVLTDLGQPDDVAYEVLVEGDGRIVVAGQSGLRSLGVARYLPSGALDTTFAGGAGKRTYSLGLTGNTTFVGGLRRDAAGGYLTTVPGTTSDGGTQSHLVRIRGNGDLDTAFGVRRLQAPYAAAWKEVLARDVLLQSDGKIVISGYGNAHENGSRDGLVLRCNADGTPDTSFANGGLFATLLRPELDSTAATALAPDAKLMVAVNRWPAGSGAVCVMMRLLPNGTLDPTFGTGGIGAAATHPGGGCGGYGAAFDAATGRVVVGGAASGHPMIARWLTD